MKRKKKARKNSSKILSIALQAKISNTIGTAIRTEADSAQTSVYG